MQTRRDTLIFACALGALLSPFAARGADKATAADAMAMVQKGVALVKSAGKEKAFAEFNDPANKTFHDRDLYIYVFDLNGVSLAHGNNPKLIGKNLITMKDVQGKSMIKEQVELARGKGSGWVDFNWPNPLTKAVEPKSGYVERVDDFLIGCGIYK